MRIHLTERPRGIYREEDPQRGKGSPGSLEKERTVVLTGLVLAVSSVVLWWVVSLIFTTMSRDYCGLLKYALRLGREEGR